MVIVVYIPFGDLMHGEREPGGKYWRRCLGNQDWWIQRAKVLKEYTLRSLNNQSNDEFIVVAGIAVEVNPEFSAPVIEVLADFGADIVTFQAAETLDRGQCAPQSLLRRYGGSAPLKLVWLDSDDMYSRDALAIIEHESCEPGAVLMFRRGYIWRPEAKELYVYNPGVCPPPFFTRHYSADAFEDLDAYERLHTFYNYHHHLFASRTKVDMPDDQFCVVVHGTNTSTVLEAWKVQNKIGRKIKIGEYETVIRRFLG